MLDVHDLNAVLVLASHLAHRILWSGRMIANKRATLAPADFEMWRNEIGLTDEGLVDALERASRGDRPDPFDADIAAFLEFIRQSTYKRKAIPTVAA